MNVAEQNVFFGLLRYSLWGSKINYDLWRGDWEWSAILKAIDEQALATLMLEAVLALPESLQPKEDEVVRLSKQMGANMLRHGSLNKDLIEIFKVLESKGLHPVLLKGQGNATFYRKPLLRKCGDLDIYIGIENFEEASVALRSWKPDKCVVGKNIKKHASFLFGQTEVELHRFVEIQRFPYPDLPFQSILRRELGNSEFVDVENYPVAVLPAQVNALYIFTHLWNHVRRGGVGLRQLCDFAVVLRKTIDRINVDVLKCDLRQMKMLEEWMLVGNVLVDYLGVPKEEYPLFETGVKMRSDSLIRLILMDGNFGSKRNTVIRGGYLRSKYGKILLDAKRSKQIAKISKIMALKLFVGRFLQGMLTIIKGG